MGDLNLKLAEPEVDRREEEIVAALTITGIKDMSDHFLPRQSPWCRDGRRWTIVWAVREVRSQKYYIIGIDHCLFRNMTVWDPQHNSGDYLVLGCLRGAPLRKYCFSIINEIYEYYEARSDISIFQLNELFSHHFWGFKLEILDPSNVRKPIRFPDLSNKYVSIFLTST